MLQTNAKASESPYRLRTTCPTCIRARTTDLSPRSAFIRAKKLEDEYAKRLRGIARIIDHIVRGFDVTDLAGIAAAQEALNRYAATLTPWAQAVGRRMVTEVAARDERSWFRIAAQMGRALRKEIETAPTGRVMQERIAEQVTLITSLPRESAQRVHRLATEARIQGTRPEALAREILRTGEVSRSRATLIARTETSRTATELTRARALHVGSTHFIWHTVHDRDVRASHQKLDGKTFRWDDPPISDPPDKRSLPGGIYNCRCFAQPIIPDL